MTWPLRYICKWCAAMIAEYPDVRATEPNTLSCCDKPECRAKSSAEWKAS